jgi:DsbE subfamily thiol:disulfide oxidoreductase
MKIKILALALLISFCSPNTIDERIFIELTDLNNLKTLDTKENIDISDSELLIINYWASWCLECIEEHPYLIELSKTKGFENVVYMLSFQDSRENALKFITEYGTGNINYVIDENSKVAIYSGVFGVPETHILKNGEVIKKYIGPISINDFQEIINNYSHLTN